jgi:cob(I)alamin adenosyltransferase
MVEKKMKIYTKRGDAGQTDLFGGARVSKAHGRVKAYGAVDAANSAIGFVMCSQYIPEKIINLLPEIMSDLFDIGAELATAPKEPAQLKLEKIMISKITSLRILELESYIDAADSRLPALTSFVLPTGSEGAGRFHLARIAVRQAEQEIIALCEQGERIREEVLAYINRLSDLMFIWARLCNLEAGIEEVLWRT